MRPRCGAQGIAHLSRPLVESSFDSCSAVITGVAYAQNRAMLRCYFLTPGVEGDDMTTVVTAKTVSVKLSPSVAGRVKTLAEAKNRTPHFLMREAIETYVEREEKREAFRQDALQAWEEYQQTGLHLTGDEVDAWLEKLEAGEDAEMPECHR